MSSPTAYTSTAIRLHWLIALGLVGSFSVGTYMVGLQLTPHKLQVISWHKWAGVTLFLLILIRLAWRLTHTPPALPASVPAWQVRVAAATHHLLYVLMLAIPLTGWLMSSAKGFQTVWFGVLPIPDLLAKDKELGNFLRDLHMVLNYTLAALVAAHVGAGLKHYLIDRDGVLQRMIPWLKHR
jgi:cytochrome b561